MAEQLATMVGIKTAVKAAVDFLSGLYEGQGIRDVRLEEIQLSEENDCWLVTLSFQQLVPSTNPLAGVLQNVMPPQYERVYKVVAVDARTGDPKSLKIRQ